MPNNTTCILKFSDWSSTGILNKIKESILNEKLEIDFAKIITPPNNDAYNDLPNQKEAEKSPDWWYNWNSENWGTKWNAYNNELLQNDDNWLWIKFQTAWDFPKPIINKILELYPNIYIEFIASCEGGWFAYHLKKEANEESEINIWNNETDQDSKVRNLVSSII